MSIARSVSQPPGRVSITANVAAIATSAQAIAPPTRVPAVCAGLDHHHRKASAANTITGAMTTNRVDRESLNPPHTVVTSGELVIFSGCFVGACIGFLWYNAFPAKVFMGDTGSLMIGGVIASLAILIRKELLIPLLCGIFLVENLSVILQVYYFKYTRIKYGEGRRIFRMSPLHHHYQKLGMHESQIVTRFWIVGILLAVLTIITLKVR
jgi:phospho-N-acetylmuramoyl-pentapeptide-transferase